MQRRWAQRASQGSKGTPWGQARPTPYAAPAGRARLLPLGADGWRTPSTAPNHTFANRDGEWLFAERRLYVDWTETRTSRP